MARPDGSRQADDREHEIRRRVVGSSRWTVGIGRGRLIEPEQAKRRVFGVF